MDGVCRLARLITSTRVYLQGRARQISLRRNDTKQVRDVSASQCVVAHLPSTLIPLSVSGGKLYFLTQPDNTHIICTDAKDECLSVCISNQTSGSKNQTDKKISGITISKKH